MCFSMLILSACNSKLFIDTGNKINKDKTQLHVHNFDGGVGTEWLEKDIARFEEKYKNTSFEEGKTGVQIVPGKD